MCSGTCLQCLHLCHAGGEVPAVVPWLCFGWRHSLISNTSQHRCVQALKSSSRLAYCILFTFSLLLSWILRDFAKPLLEKIPCEVADQPWPGSRALQLASWWNTP